MCRVTIRGLLAQEAAPAHHRARGRCSAWRSWPGRSCSPTRSGKAFDDLFADVNRGTDAVVRGQAVFKSDFGGVRAASRAVARHDRSRAPRASPRPKAQSRGTRSGRIGREGDRAPDRLPRSAAAGAWSTRAQPVRPRRGRPRRGRSEIVIDKAQRRRRRLRGRRHGEGDAQGSDAGDDDRRHREVRRRGHAGRRHVRRVHSTPLRSCRPNPVRSTRSRGRRSGRLTEQVAANISDGRAPADVEVLTGERSPRRTRATSTKSLELLQHLPARVRRRRAASSAMFIIYNTFSILVAQRTPRAGAAAGDRRQATPGARRRCSSRRSRRARRVGPRAGRGIGVAVGLKAAARRARLRRPERRSWSQTRTVIAALIVGVGVTVVSAFFPARRGRGSRRRGDARRRDRHVGVVPQANRPRPGRARARRPPPCGRPGQGRGVGRGQVGLGALVVFVAATILGPVIAKP